MSRKLLRDLTAKRITLSDLREPIWETWTNSTHEPDYFRCGGMRLHVTDLKHRISTYRNRIRFCVSCIAEADIETETYKKITLDLSKT